MQISNTHTHTHTHTHTLQVGPDTFFESVASFCDAFHKTVDDIEEQKNKAEKQRKREEEEEKKQQKKEEQAKARAIKLGKVRKQT